MTAPPAASPPTDGLVLRGITRSYGPHRALNGVDLHVRPGELACLIGPNGAGKSTLMRIIAGIQSPDSGEVLVDGVRINGSDASESMLFEARRLVAITPQELDLFDHLTPDETLRTVCRLRGLADAESTHLIAFWMRELLLEGTRLRMVRELSGGQKRKVAIAAALITSPRVAVLDESFTGLDPESVAAVERRLRAFCDDGGMVLLSSHVLDLVQRLADRLVTMRPGTVCEDIDRRRLDELLAGSFPHLGAYYLDRVGDAARGEA